MTNHAKKLGAAFIAAAALLCGCDRAPEGPAGPALFDVDLVDGQRALDEVARLVALGLRDSGTPGAARAAAHLKLRLEAAGCEAAIDAFEDATPEGVVTFRNVTGRLAGAEPGLIVLGSHYDTKRGMGPGFEGANDSGSSTGLLLELARVFRAGGRQGPELLFVLFDGEECMQKYGPRDGLHGSRRLARELRRSGRADEVLAVIVLDMVGDRDLTVTLPRNGSPELLTAVFGVARLEGVRSNFKLAGSRILDDHVPFLEAGMPAVDIIDFEFGSAPGKNDYWHTPADTMDKLSAASLGTVGRVVVRLVNGLRSDARSQ